MKLKLFMTAVCSSLLTALVAYASLNFDIDSTALNNASIVNNLAPTFSNLNSSYLEISAEENQDGDSQAQEILLRQLSKDTALSAVDLNAKFVSYVILQKKLDCELRETGYWDTSSNDCVSANSCSDYQYFKTCTQDLSSLGNCAWQDVGGNNFQCVTN